MRKVLRGSTGRVFVNIFFSIQFMLWDVVLCADSEYHMHFALKLIFVDHSLRIPAYFVTFSPRIPVFPQFEHVLHFFSYFASYIRIEHEKLHRSIYITHWIKNSLGKKLAYTL